MNIVLSEYISWQYFLIGLLILLFIIWLIFGGNRDVKYVGLAPLQIGVDANTNEPHQIKMNTTPCVPKALKRLKRTKIPKEELEEELNIEEERSRFEKSINEDDDSFIKGEKRKKEKEEKTLKQKLVRL